VKFSIPFNERIFRDFKLFVVSALIENEGRALYMPMIIDSAASYITVRREPLISMSGIGLQRSGTRPNQSGRTTGFLNFIAHTS
jgi:hypothetical protein